MSTITSHRPREKEGAWITGLTMETWKALRFPGESSENVSPHASQYLPLPWFAWAILWNLVCFQRSRCKPCSFTKAFGMAALPVKLDATPAAALNTRLTWSMTT